MGFVCIVVWMVLVLFYGERDNRWIGEWFVVFGVVVFVYIIEVKCVCVKSLISVML